MAGSTDFPTSLDSLGSVTDGVDDVDDDHVNDLRRAVEALETKVGIDSSAVTTSLDYLVNNFIASGRALWIYEDGAAPTGWSLDAAADAVLGVIGGAQAYNAAAGQVLGTWTQPDHTLITSEMPAHTHTGPRGTTVGAGAYITGATVFAAHSITTGSTGGGGAHNHGTTHRPAAALGQIIVKT